MNIEKVAFKDRKILAQLNKNDSLDIIEFLQNDRKQWINQFTQTHNESILLIKENQELKKQLETYEIEGYEQNEELNKMSFDIRKYKTQQKEFIEHLEDEIKRINPKELDIGELNLRLNDIKFTQYLIYKEILQKYKEIIGGINENQRN